MTLSDTNKFKTNLFDSNGILTAENIPCQSEPGGNSNEGVLVLTNCPEYLGSIPGRAISKTLKMVLDTSLLNTQQYKVRIRGTVEQFTERGSALSYFSV